MAMSNRDIEAWEARGLAEEIGHSPGLAALDINPTKRNTPDRTKKNLNISYLLKSSL
jgi:hypothetical protein